MNHRAKLTRVDEVSGIVVDFGSHTTRAGYAGEDCPRVVCPSAYGYIDEAANGDGDVEMNGGSGKKRKYYMGEDGLGVWRAGMEVGEFMTDSMGPSSTLSMLRKR